VRNHHDQQHHWYQRPEHAELQVGGLYDRKAMVESRSAAGDQPTRITVNAACPGFTDPNNFQGTRTV
jgi:hypothetical protein